jgi:hypothetical protein
MGVPPGRILQLVARAREVHARSPFVRRLQSWPRGYPGDFETVEYLLSQEVMAPRGAWTIRPRLGGRTVRLPAGPPRRLFDPERLQKAARGKRRVLFHQHRQREPIPCSDRICGGLAIARTVRSGDRSVDEDRPGRRLDSCDRARPNGIGLAGHGDPTTAGPDSVSTG